jgi:hypothetical protein
MNWIRVLGQGEVLVLYVHMYVVIKHLEMGMRKKQGRIDVDEK